MSQGASMLIYIKSVYPLPSSSHIFYNALKSNGTLLPLPALYFFGPPRKSLGLDIKLSSLNCHLESLTTNLPPVLGEGECDGCRLGIGEPAPFADKVYELGSSIDCSREAPRLRD